ncbi:MAG: hypothetical protein IT348_15910 [Candidatus Eisenbacteria bacterium]|nr:hypothetical protein [Candidatus Eisenbacteria bacterium]
MRRAIQVLLLVVAAATCFAVPGYTQPQVVRRINGIGILDYAHKPTFKVGDWVRYRMTGQSELGMSDDYELTILIAGEEEWWGEECFWVETWTDTKGRPPETAATMMSYAIFDDSAAVQHMQVYQRKAISDLNEAGLPTENVVRPASSTLKARNLFKRPMMWDVDTLEADTVHTPMGTLNTRKISFKEGTGVTSSMGDSTNYTEVRETRTTWFTLEVPLTHIAREDLENTISRRTWMIGRSAEGAPMRLREKGTGSARLIAYGHGEKARMLPLERQKSLAQLRAEAARKKATPTAAAPKRR